MSSASSFGITGFSERTELRVESRAKGTRWLHQGIILWGLIFASGWLPSPASAQELADAEKKSLLEIRQALAERRMTDAKAALDKVGETKGSEKYISEVERLELLYGYVSQFWSAVNSGAQRFRTLDEFVVGDTIVAFVEFDGREFKIKVEGTIKRYTLETVKPKVAVAISLKYLNDKALSTKVIIGSFWLADMMGDREVARKMLSEAKAAGAKDIDILMGELSVAPAPVVQLAPPTPQQKALLTPLAWLVQKRTGAQVARAPLGTLGMMTGEGRLQVGWPTDQKEPAQVVFRQRAAGNFSCKATLQNVPEDQKFGLFAGEGKETGYVVALPAGTVQIEFSRKGDDVKCQINGEEAPVQMLPGSNPRMPGLLGVTLPPGGQCVIASFEVK